MRIFKFQHVLLVFAAQTWHLCSLVVVVVVVIVSVVAVVVIVFVNIVVGKTYDLHYEYGTE